MHKLANTIISLPPVVASDNSRIRMLSTHSKNTELRFVFISNLSSLLKERGKTQKELAAQTGLLPERISRLVHQRVVHRIFAETSIKVITVLSRWPRPKDRKRIQIGLDDLFLLKRDTGRKKR
jgi:hypothetical protein